MAGSRFWSSGLMTALRTEAGSLRGFVKIFRALTERWQAQEALHACEDARRILEAHGSRITVGEAADPGAEIVLTLPRRKL